MVYTTLRKMIFFIALLLAAQIMLAQKNNMHERLDSLFNALAAGNKAMGSICISQNGKPIYSHATGYSQMESPKKIQATEATKYRVASITKMFTAAIIFQLVQEGKIDFANTLDEYFPQIPGASKITIAMMLSHRSGLHNLLDDPDYPSWKEIPKRQDEVIKMISKYALDFTPDSRASYSNSNFILLGYIIESKCKKPYSEVVQERVINRIGLKNTYYGGKTNTDNNESFSYVYNGSWVRQTSADVSILAAAGALVSTPEDLTKFIEALFTRKVIKHRYLNSMQNITDGFGMGMMPFPYLDHMAYGHTGNIDGFNSMLQYFPEEKIAICYCSNGLSIPLTDVMNAVLGIVFAAQEKTN